MACENPKESVWRGLKMMSQLESTPFIHKEDYLEQGVRSIVEEKTFEF